MTAPPRPLLLAKDQVPVDALGAWPLPRMDSLPKWITTKPDGTTHFDNDTEVMEADLQNLTDGNPRAPQKAFM